jgi:hypothetical protein
VRSGLIRKKTPVTDATEVAGGMIEAMTEEIIDHKEVAERLLAQA